MLTKQQLEAYKLQNPKKYKQKFVDPIVPAPLEITPSKLQSKEAIEEVVKKVETDENNSGLPTEYSTDSPKV